MNLLRGTWLDFPFHLIFGDCVCRVAVKGFASRAQFTNVFRAQASFFFADFCDLLFQSLFLHADSLAQTEPNATEKLTRLQETGQGRIVFEETPDA